MTLSQSGGITQPTPKKPQESRTVIQIHEIRRAPVTFRANGCAYSQVKRTGDLVMYHNLEADVWEVHLIRLMKPSKFLKKSTYWEKLPNNAEFGFCGWCFSKKEDAETKFDRLLVQARAQNPKRLKEAENLKDTIPKNSRIKEGGGG